MYDKYNVVLNVQNVNLRKEMEMSKEQDEQEKIIEEGLRQTAELYRKAAPEEYEVGERLEWMLPMRDGVKLRTIMQFPGKALGNNNSAETDSYPVVLQRCCYASMERTVELRAREYSKRGFLFVYQWCRGTGGSEGTWIPNINERNDGLDTLEYLNKQSYIDCIGYWGDSYLALTGWCMADAVPGKVKTMYLGVYGCNRYTSAYKDGLFRQDILTTWAMGNAGKPVQAPMLESCAYRPQIEVDEELWGVHLDWYRDWISNTDRDSAYWSGGFWKELMEIPHKVKIPVFIREGWYDHHLGSAIETYENLSEEAKEHSVIQIGPWNHGYNPVVTGQPLKNLEDDRVKSPLDWFSLILKDKKLPDGAAYTYVIGADHWKKWDTFPIQAEQKREWFLQGDHKLGERTEKESKLRFTYDPQNPVLSHGAESLLATQDEVGSLLQPEPGYRGDVMTFLSAPLQENIEIQGKIQVRLFVNSDAEDTSFTAKLMEVFENGECVNIRGSITTLAYRSGNSHRETYIPEEVVEICIEMWDIAWMLRQGSTLRLDISSSDFPQYSVHSNYPGIWSMQTQTKQAEQTILMGAAYPSEIILPVV